MSVGTFKYKNVVVKIHYKKSTPIRGKGKNMISCTRIIRNFDCRDQRNSLAAKEKDATNGKEWEKSS